MCQSCACIQLPSDAVSFHVVVSANRSLISFQDLYMCHLTLPLSSAYQLNMIKIKCTNRLMTSSIAKSATSKTGHC